MNYYTDVKEVQHKLMHKYTYNNNNTDNKCHYSNSIIEPGCSIISIHTTIKQIKSIVILK